MPVTQRLAIGRSVLLAIKSVGLLKEKERVAVRPAAGRRGRTNVVGDEGLAGSQAVVGADLEARLNPVKNGTETPPGGEGSIEVQGYNHVGGRRVGNSEGDFRGGLSFYRDGKKNSSTTSTQRAEGGDSPALGMYCLVVISLPLTATPSVFELSFS